METDGTVQFVTVVMRLLNSVLAPTLTGLFFLFLSFPLIRSKQIRAKTIKSKRFVVIYDRIKEFNMHRFDSKHAISIHNTVYFNDTARTK